MDIFRGAEPPSLSQSAPKQISQGCKVWENSWIPSSMLPLAAAPSPLVLLESKSHRRVWGGRDLKDAPVPALPSPHSAEVCWMCHGTPGFPAGALGAAKLSSHTANVDAGAPQAGITPKVSAPHRRAVRWSFGKSLLATGGVGTGNVPREPRGVAWCLQHPLPTMGQRARLPLLPFLIVTIPWCLPGLRVLQGAVGTWKLFSPS